MKKINKINLIFVFSTFLFVNTTFAQSNVPSGCISPNRTYQIICTFFERYQVRSAPTQQYIPATSTRPITQNPIRPQQQSILSILPSLLGNVRFGGASTNEPNQTQNQLNSPLTPQNSPSANNQNQNNPNQLTVDPNLKPGEITQTGSCVSFGDSLGYGMSIFGGKNTLCKYYTPTGLGDSFTKGNEGKNYNNFKTQVEQALNDPNVRLIVWELGTNGTCPTCSLQQDGAAQFYQTLATQAVQKGKLLILPVYNNKMSNNTDNMARLLGNQYKNNVIVLDYTKVTECVRGPNQDVHYNGACYSKLSKLRSEVVNKTLETKKQEKPVPIY